MGSTFQWSDVITEDYVNDLLEQELKSQVETFQAKNLGWTIELGDYITKGKYTFIIAYITLPAFGGRMHRYVMITLSGTTRIYENSNVIDATAGYTLDEVEQYTRNYFNHVAKQLNNLQGWKSSRN